MMAYVDASVLLRLALHQRDALGDWGRIRRGISSALVVTECLRTLDRLRIRVSLEDADLAQRRATILAFAGSLELVEIDSVVLGRAAQPMPTELATLDAIHLATALLWSETNNQPLVMATHDATLATAAQAHGLTVIGV